MNDDDDQHSVSLPFDLDSRGLKRSALDHVNNARFYLSLPLPLLQVLSHLAREQGETASYMIGNLLYNLVVDEEPRLLAKKQAHWERRKAEDPTLTARQDPRGPGPRKAAEEASKETLQALAEHFKYIEAATPTNK